MRKRDLRHCLRVWCRERCGYLLEGLCFWGCMNGQFTGLWIFEIDRLDRQVPNDCYLLIISDFFTK